MHDYSADIVAYPMRVSCKTLMLHGWLVAHYSSVYTSGVVWGMGVANDQLTRRKILRNADSVLLGKDLNTGQQARECK